VSVGEAKSRGETRLIQDPSGGTSLKIRGVHVVVVDGPDRGKTFVPTRHLLRVGSHPDADVVLTDPTVSREHCELAVREDRIRVRDHGSTNGTFVEGVRVHDVEIGPGTLLRFGETTVRVTTADETVQVPLSTHDRFGGLLGTSARMREVFSILERVAPTDTTVLLEGESGTGKELAAEGVHEASERSEGPFVVFDCGAVPHDLAESALFGHVRGAFTGAVSDRRGVFEEADGGTLFLDEIGDLVSDLQPKLLRALERREVRRVGDEETRRVDVRIVAATNRSLEAEVHAGRFREDLYYRLAVVRVTLPPLRARPEDVPMLVEHFLRLLAPEGKPAPTISGQLLGALGARPWPGNVRELRNVVERAISLAGLDSFGGAPAKAGIAPSTDAELRLPLHEAREAFDRRYVEAILRRNGGNVSAAAREAGVDRKLIHRLIKRYGIGDE